ncbi:NAD-P-binding protein [Epithele typhae]|uniref:NAD-P-binding protein n=1 Tax=Epithele typhae TaxID=378194 RepID=UPI002007F70B|nr:NAD-P-binding protein [Epithele typhae]KAH9927072.1 NAD-P-binding protein [Epithele typhae]
MSHPDNVRPTGISLTIAQTFSNNGAKVYTAGPHADVLEETTRVWGRALLHPHGQLASIENLRVNTLVNNARGSLGTSEVEKRDSGGGGATELREELWREDLADWESVYRTNVIGYFFTAAAFLPLLSAAARGGHTGTVINISSMLGITRTTQHHFKDNVSKAATIDLTTLLAQEFCRPTATRLLSRARRRASRRGQPGKEEDMAQTVLFSACYEYAYGQIVAAEGGYLLEHP